MKHNYNDFSKRNGSKQTNWTDGLPLLATMIFLGWVVLMGILLADAFLVVNG